MNILNRYTVSSVFKVGIGVTLLASFMLLGVDLFRNMDSYISNAVPSSTIVRLTFMFFPQAFLYAVGPAFLFATTFFLSMMYSNNEIIAVLNSSIKYSRIVRVIVFCGLLVSLFYFFFNEKISIPVTMYKDKLYESSIAEKTDSEDNFRIALSDMTENYMVYAEQYLSNVKQLSGITFVKVLEDGTIIRVNADSAVWIEELNSWEFSNATIYRFYTGNVETQIDFYEKYISEYMHLAPDMFRNLSNDISSMPLDLSLKYVRQMKTLDINQYHEMATSFYNRILSCLTPLVLVIIGCSMNYRFKKNILFLSIVFSVSVAVVYYVIRIMTVMMAQQGLIAPYLGSLAPLFLVLVFSFVVSLFIRS